MKPSWKSIAAVVLLARALLSASPAHAETLTGTITDAVNTSALSGVTVRVVELSLTQTTNASGIYDFGDLPAGTYTVRAQVAGYTSQDKTVTLQPERLPPAAPRNLHTR